MLCGVGVYEPKMPKFVDFSGKPLSIMAGGIWMGQPPCLSAQAQAAGIRLIFVLLGHSKELSAIGAHIFKAIRRELGEFFIWNCPLGYEALPTVVSPNSTWCTIRERYNWQVNSEQTKVYRLSNFVQQRLIR